MEHNKTVAEGNNPQNQENSMEDILASIKQIMSYDLSEEAYVNEENSSSSAAKQEIEGKTAQENDRFLELTQRVEPLDMPKKSKNMRSSCEEEISIATFTPASDKKEKDDQSLLSKEALSASMNALSQLNQALSPKKSIQSNESLETFLHNMLRPLLKEWLDKNLPHLVESVVEKEIQELKKKL